MIYVYYTLGIHSELPKMGGGGVVGKMGLEFQHVHDTVLAERKTSEEKGGTSSDAVLLELKTREGTNKNLFRK